MKIFLTCLGAAVVGFMLAIYLPLPSDDGIPRGSVQNANLIRIVNATSTTGVSKAISIDGAKRVTLGFNMANVTDNGTATSSTAISVSVDGSNYVTYSKLVDNVTNTNSQDLTRVATQSFSANGSDFLSLDLAHDIFKFMKLTNTITGTTTAQLTITALMDY